MANEIDLVVGSAVKTQLDTLMAELVLIDNQIKDIGKSAVAMNNALGVKDTASLTKLTAENAKLNKEIEKLTGSAAVLETKLANLASAQAKETKAKEQAAKATTDAAIAEEKLIAAKQRNTDATQRNADKEAKASQTRSKYITQETIDIRLKNKELAQEYTELSKNAGAYDKADAQYKIMAKSLKDLAFQGKEGTKDFIEKEKALTTLGNRLKSVDAMTGSHTRNVGNYASSWNGLGNSINQLTREAPAFANSVQTGFMALSNNIPILTDELGVLIDKNKKLQEQGKPTESILKTVAGAFFSWQTAISLGVTILTVYGAKLVDMMFNTDGVKRATDSLTNSLKLQQTQLDKNIKVLEYNAEIEIELAKKRGASEKEIFEIKKKLGIDTVSETEKQYNILNARIDSFDKYRALREKDKSQAFLFLRNKYNGDDEKATKEYQRREVAYTDANRKLLVDSKTKLYEQLKEKNDKNVLDDLRSQNELNNKKDTNNKKEDKSEEERLKNKYDRELSDLNRSKELIQDKYDAEEEGTRMRISLSNELALSQIKIIEAQYNEEVRLAKNNADLIKIADNNLATARENILKENGKRIIAEQEKIHKKIGELANEEKYGVDTYFMPIEDVKTWVDEWNRIQKDKADKDKQNAADKKKSDEEQAAYLQSFVSEFASNSGLTETFKMMSGQIEGFGTDTKVTFNAVAEASQEMFNKIAEYSMANYEQEYARLESQKETSLKFAGDSTAAKEKIEKDYAAKKKEIDKRKFEDEKKISMVNIVIDTAQAIMATLKETGFFGTPLALIIGAFGAAQLAMVAAQQFPAYAEGTDNHSGGLMLVNDGAGSNYQEKVVLPSGKVIRPQGRNVLMNAPKGTKVLNHEQQLFEMLQSNNISMASPQYQGMTPDEMDEILGKHFGNIKTQNTIFDKNGFQSYVKNGNSITRSNSNRSQAIGISV